MPLNSEFGHANWTKGSLFELPEFDGHEEVSFFGDDSVALRAILAIHSTTLGPALGGCRMLPYPSSADAVGDVLRLSRAMTYKAACAGVPFGGGKCVVIGNPSTDKRSALLRRLGNSLAHFNGRFFLGEDVGTTAEDMATIHLEAPNVVGLPEEAGGSGDPSVWTTRGCMVGIRTTVHAALGTNSLKGVRVAVQGLGNVGGRLCEALAAEGTELVVADVRAERANEMAERYDAALVSPDEVLDSDVDVFAPCALGGVLSDETVARIRARVVAGCANNQLADLSVGTALKDRKILYAPDYIINAGGMIRLAAEILSWSEARLLSTIDNIASTLEHTFRLAESLDMPTSEAAERVAQERLGSTNPRTSSGEPSLSQRCQWLHKPVRQ